MSPRNAQQKFRSKHWHKNAFSHWQCQRLINWSGEAGRVSNCCTKLLRLRNRISDSIRILSYLISGISVLINLLLENKVGRYNFPPFKIKSGSENRLRTLSAVDGEEKRVGLLAEERERERDRKREMWGREMENEKEWESKSTSSRNLYTLWGKKDERKRMVISATWAMNLCLLPRQWSSQKKTLSSPRLISCQDGMKIDQ